MKFVNYKNALKKKNTYLTKVIFLTAINEFFFLVQKKNNFDIRFFKFNKINLINYSTNLILKRGLKFKAHTFLKNAFKQFFELFIFCNDKNFTQKYHYFNILKSYSLSWDNFFNINKFLYLILPMFEFIFTFKCVKVDKKLKTNTSRYNLVFSYITKSKRLSYLIKLLYHNSDSFDLFKFSDRLFLSYVNTFFFLKTSLIYLQKIKFYKKIMTGSFIK